MESKSLPYWQLDAISKHSTDAIVIVDTDQRIRFASPNVAEGIGYDPTGDNIYDLLQNLIHPDDKTVVLDRYTNVVQKLHLGYSEHRGIDKFGNIRYFESRTTPLEGSEENLTISIIRDVTEKKLMELELEKRKNHYEALQKSLKAFSQDLSSILKRSELETRLIQEVSAILPGSDPYIIKLNNITHEVIGNQVGDIQAYFPQLLIGKVERLEQSYAIRIGDRADHTILLVLNACTDDMADIIWIETLAYYARMVLESLNVMENIMNQVESSIQRNETPLWMLRLLFSLSEKERHNLSADLHDTVLQEQITLDTSLKELLLENDIDTDTKAKLHEIENGLEDSIHQIRSICNELRPPFLRDLGLVTALENLFEHTQAYNANYRVHYSTQNMSALQLDEEQTVGVYRIIQELINNATKHSKALNVYIKLAAETESFVFEYVDDGVGFELDRLKPSYSNMGLTSMIQRVETLLGKIEFHSKPNRGLKVIIKVPYKK